MANRNDEPITVTLRVSIHPQDYQEIKEITRFDGYPGEKALLIDILRTGINERSRENKKAKEAAHRNR